MTAPLLMAGVKYPQRVLCVPAAGPVYIFQMKEPGRPIHPGWA